MSDHTTELLGRERVRALLEDVLRRASADGIEAMLTVDRGALTRFAESHIHQNVAHETPTLSVRAVFGRRVGRAATGRLDDAGLADVVTQAEAIARLTPENEGFPGLPEPDGEPAEIAYSPATVQSDPETRAAAAAVACRLAREAGLQASGFAATGGQEIAVANSRGLFAYTRRSVARMIVVATGETGSGRAEGNALDLADVDPESLARRAVDIGRLAQHPIAVPAGDYTVILQPDAVSDVAQFLSRLAFGGRAASEGRSFVSGKRGERVLGENVTIWDDGTDPRGLPMPFDVEGVPRQRLNLIERGVAGDVALDSVYAAKLGVRSNGHAVSPTVPFYAGPAPTNVFIAPGEASVEEMIRSTERGILVTRFHYTRVVHPLHVIITGMTRDGTFLIERGAVTRPVKNLRFTQSYRDALCDVQAVGRDTSLAGEVVVSRVPALKIGSFAFTGVTE